MLSVISYEHPHASGYTLAGRFDGLGAREFDAIFSTASSHRYSLLDFQQVHYLSSAGIRSLLKAEKQLRKAGGKLLLIALSDDLKQVLSLTGLLNQFSIFTTLEQAEQWLQERDGEGQTSSGMFSVADRHYHCVEYSQATSVIDLWGADVLQELTPGAAIATDSHELEFAFGIGGMGTTAEQAAEATGELVAMHSVVGVVPADCHCESDFMQAADARPVSVYVQQALGLSGTPQWRVTFDVKAPITLQNLLEDVQTLTEQSPLTGFVVAGKAETVQCTRHHSDDELLEHGCAPQQLGSSAFVAVGVYSNDVTARFPHTAQRVASGQMHSHALLLSELDDVQTTDAPIDVVRRNSGLQKLQQVCHLHPDTTLTNGVVWLYVPQHERDAAEKQLKIHYATAVKEHPHWQPIIREIYRDAARVELTQLQGGFSAQTFSAVSYDRDGRRLLPTVLKLASRADLNREVDAYHASVEKFILNNSTTIMGTAEHGDWAGLRYNFVGINGSQSELRWLTKEYLNRPTAELLPLFDRIFTDILKPWYGQPRWKSIQLYKHHDPAELFPGILDDAQKELSIDVDEPTIECLPLGRRLPNPYYALKHEYPKRKKDASMWYLGINHGDLNMQNILLNELNNIYVIDFSETCERNIISDFARLEPIFKMEFTRLDTEEDLRNLLIFEEGLHQVTSLEQMPENRYPGDDPMVEKAYQLLCRMRHYANVVTLFEQDLRPWLLALLEWTLPVVCYWSVDRLRKQYALYSSALLWEAIQRCESH
jgi:anti-anti-sigma factor